MDPASSSATVQRIGRDDPRFPATICSLGLLGVITRVRFGLVEERHFDVLQEIVDLDDVLRDLEGTSATYDFWRVNWMHKSNKALLWAATAVPVSQSTPDGDYPVDQSEQVLDFVVNAIDMTVGMGPYLNGVFEAIYRGLALTYGTRRFSGPLRNMLPVDRRVPCTSPWLSGASSRETSTRCSVSAKSTAAARGGRTSPPRSS